MTEIVAVGRRSKNYKCYKNSMESRFTKENVKEQREGKGVQYNV